MLDLIEQSRLAVNELNAVLGRASAEGVLRLSAEGIAGPPHLGKKGGAVGWLGSERSTLSLAERRSRLRKKAQGQEGEVSVPAYEAMQQDGRLSRRMLEILLRGVHQAVCERLVIYLGGMAFGDHHTMSAVSVEYSGTPHHHGRKHALGIAQGAVFICDRWFERAARDATLESLYGRSLGFARLRRQTCRCTSCKGIHRAARSNRTRFAWCSRASTISGNRAARNLRRS
jgi:hypothetical protein